MRRISHAVRTAAMLSLLPSALHAYQPNNANGQAAIANSQPVAQSPAQWSSFSNYTRSTTVAAYAAGNLVANSSLSSLVTLLSWNLGNAVGVPVNIFGGMIRTQQSSGVAMSSITNGQFRVHLFPSAPTFTAGLTGDAGAMSSQLTLANECGWLDGTLKYSGTDYSIGFMTPGSGGSVVPCTPSSQTVYGVVEAQAAFIPTSGEIVGVNIFNQ